jgi:hypothetical protein
MNTGAYGHCKANCTLGPRCGDNVKQSNEQCDNGRNVDTYVTSSGGNACAPGCLLPPSCGDGKVDGSHGEQCDQGTANNTGAYGHCKANCTLGTALRRWHPSVHRAVRRRQRTTAPGALARPLCLRPALR